MPQTPNIYVLGLFGKTNPPDGEKTTGPIALNLTANVPLQINLRAWQTGDLQAISSAQSMYVDNGGNANALVFTMSSGQVISVPADTQGYFNILQPNPIAFSVSCVGNCTASVMLQNFQIFSNYWTAPTL